MMIDFEKERQTLNNTIRCWVKEKMTDIITNDINILIYIPQTST